MMKQRSIEFALSDIKTLQFALFEENLDLKSDEDFVINASLEFGVSMSDKGVQVILELIIERDDKILIKIEVASEFLVDQSTWETFYSESELILPLSFLTHVTKITVGATRGILLAKTEYSEFKDFLLPLIDIEGLIAEDAYFSLDEE